MNEQFKSLESKIDKLDERLDSIDKTLVKQEENLKLHMYRTELAEKAIEMLAADLKPVKAHVSHVEGLFKYLGIMAVIIGAIVGIKKLF